MTTLPIVAILILVVYILVGLFIYKFTRSSYKPIIVWWFPLLIIMALVRSGLISFGCISDTTKGVDTT